jgi:DNA-binding NtrC family response regulator
MQPCISPRQQIFSGATIMSARIAIFNHSPNLLLLYSAVLQRYGYQTFIYQQEMVSFEEIIDVQPELIILGNIRSLEDQEFNMIYELKTKPEFAHIPIIICSSFGDYIRNNLPTTTLDKVFVVSKPFHINSLLSHLEKALKAESNPS